MTKTVEIFTDGACSGNPGPGGWGTILRFNGVEKELSGGMDDTTNNRMEIMAVLEGLRALTRPCQVTVYTDSKYVMDSATKWLEGWVRKGWKTASKKKVKNQDLWEALYQEMKNHDLKWVWIKGHSGHPENERADALARKYQESL